VQSRDTAKSRDTAQTAAPSRDTAQSRDLNRGGVPGGTAVVAGAVVAVAAEAAVVAVEAGGNHDYFTIVFRQKLHGGENDVFLYKRWNSKHAAFFHDYNSGGTSLSSTTKQKEFKSPSDAVQAFVAALKKNNEKVLLAILGPGGNEIISSGDEVDDLQARQAFLNAYNEQNRRGKLF
jgi:hypothetical protein